MSPGQLLCKGKKIKRHSVSENQWLLQVKAGCSLWWMQCVKFFRALETDFCRYCRCCEVQMFDFMFSPVTQVVSVAISCPSRSSPLTAACGLSSAAAVTGWEKVSLLFMKVSTHFLPCMLNAWSDHTSNNMCRSCSKKTQPFLAVLLLMCQAFYAALIRFWPGFTFSSIVCRPCKGMIYVCECEGIQLIPNA